MTLVAGARFCIDAALGEQDGDINAVGTDYTELAQDVLPGDRLLLNDGLIQLRVLSVQGEAVHCEVEAGGVLSNHKGINKQGGGLSAGALTAKDREDILTAAALEVDYLAVSFVRRALDIELTRELLRGAGGHGRIVAKIERSEAVAALESIVEAADAVMVARGDLGVEIGDAELPGVQKRIIAVARELNRPCITATQMMESMIENPVPTRAEVLDVANAVMDGTDAVMLSAETSVGAYPVRVVETVARICLGAERYPVTERSAAQFASHFARTDEAIAMAAMYVARNGRISAAVALTDSGHTALLLSRLLHGVPIFAMTEHARTRRRLALLRGVTAVNFDRGALPYERVARDALELLKARGLLSHRHARADHQGRPARLRAYQHAAVAGRELTGRGTRPQRSERSKHPDARSAKGAGAAPTQTTPSSFSRPRIHSRFSGATWRIGERMTPPAMPSAS